jgi:hypothetical protein
VLFRSANLVFVLGESIEADMQNAFGDNAAPGDMLEVSVTITYSDGYRKTYTTQLNRDDDAR